MVSVKPPIRTRLIYIYLASWEVLLLGLFSLMGHILGNLFSRGEYQLKPDLISV